MKFLSQKPFSAQGNGKQPNWQLEDKLLLLQQWAAQLLQKARSGLSQFEKNPGRSSPWQSLPARVVSFLDQVAQTGLTPAMDDYERRKLRIFNLLNFLQLVTGILIPVVGLYSSSKFPATAWATAALPPFMSIAVLWFNARRQYFAALLAYFVGYPFITGFVYLSGINMGLELTFILYGILSVFFIQEISQMLFALGLSMVNYFILAIVCKHYTYQLATANTGWFYFNQLLCIGYIFYGLFLIKKENAGYYQNILRQKEILSSNEKLLKAQTEELTELNALKSRLFSIIAHDLKSPMYALRNLFRNIQQQDLPADEIKELVPEVVGELTFTTSLMENLLEWARSQMQQDTVNKQLIDIADLLADTARLLRLQAETKRIHIRNQTSPGALAFADRDMIHLVLRNLLSNAIKYTPEQGTIQIGVQKLGTGVEVFVKDSGKGITAEALTKINQQAYYTTKGTAGESGTGLGLMLCREFLSRNDGKLHIESQPGNGSTFSFTLPAGT